MADSGPFLTHRQIVAVLIVDALYRDCIADGGVSCRGFVRVSESRLN